MIDVESLFAPPDSNMTKMVAMSNSTPRGGTRHRCPLQPLLLAAGTPAGTNTAMAIDAAPGCVPRFEFRWRFREPIVQHSLHLLMVIGLCGYMIRGVTADGDCFVVRWYSRTRYLSDSEESGAVSWRIGAVPRVDLSQC